MRGIRASVPTCPAGTITASSPELDASKKSAFSRIGRDSLLPTWVT
ncbi:MAG: hypothetical protein ABR576_03130 [Thermoanaerobaculia bacterium]